MIMQHLSVAFAALLAVVLHLQLQQYLVASSSEVSLDVGSGAASQLIREAIHQVLSSPRPLYLSFRTHHQPLLLPLAHIKTYNRISYSNVTIKFYPNTVRLTASNIRVHSKSDIRPNIWPMSFGDETIDLGLFVSYSFVLTIQCLTASSWLLSGVYHFMCHPLKHRGNIIFMRHPLKHYALLLLFSFTLRQTPGNSMLKISEKEIGEGVDTVHCCPFWGIAESSFHSVLNK